MDLPPSQQLKFERDAGGRDPRIEDEMGADGNRGVQEEALRISRKERLLSINENTPVGGEHPIGSGLQNKGEVLIETELRYNPVVDVAEIKEIADTCADIGLKGAKLGKMILKEGPD